MVDLWDAARDLLSGPADEDDGDPDSSLDAFLDQYSDRDPEEADHEQQRPARRHHAVAAIDTDDSGGMFDVVEGFLRAPGSDEDSGREQREHRRTPNVYEDNRQYHRSTGNEHGWQDSQEYYDADEHMATDYSPTADHSSGHHSRKEGPDAFGREHSWEKAPGEGADRLLLQQLLLCDGGRSVAC